MHRCIITGQRNGKHSQPVTRNRWQAPAARHNSLVWIYHRFPHTYACTPHDAKTNKSITVLLSIHAAFVLDLFRQRWDIHNVLERASHWWSLPLSTWLEARLQFIMLTRQANRKQIIDQNNTSILNSFSRWLN